MAIPMAMNMRYGQTWMNDPNSMPLFWQGDTQARGIGQLEFVALMAMMVSLTALSIDAILPALEQIGNDFGGFVLPLIGGFALFAMVSLLIVHWTESSRVQTGHG